MENYNLGYVPNLSERLQKLNTPSALSLATESIGLTWFANGVNQVTFECRKQDGVWFEMHVKMSRLLMISDPYGRISYYAYQGVAIDNPAGIFTVFPNPLISLGGYDYVILEQNFVLICMAAGQQLDTFYNFTPLYVRDGETLMAPANTYEPFEI